MSEGEEEMGSVADESHRTLNPNLNLNQQSKDAD